MKPSRATNQNQMRPTTILVASLVLLLALAFSAFKDRFKQEARFNGPVKNLLPKRDQLLTWRVTDAPIADTPEMRKRVLDILDYDDVAYAIYQKGDLRISIYIAYWQPGKVSVRSVAKHTPDVCWTLAGWECTLREELPALGVGGETLAHTEHRTFAINGQIEHVVFWHIAGDEVVSYHTGGRPPWHAAIGEFIRWGNQFKREQFFLRISSNKPLGEFRETAVMQQITEKFAAIPGFIR